MKRIIILTVAMLMVAGFAQANDISEKWGVGLTFGEMKLVGGEHDYSNVDQNFGMWYRAGLTPRWSLEGAFRFGYVRPGVGLPDEDAGITFDSSHAYFTNIMHGTLGARYHFAPDSRFSPYAGLQAGFLDFRVRDENGNTDVAMIPDGEIVIGYDETGRVNDLSSAHLTVGATLGTEFFFSDAVSMDLALRYTQIIDNSLDNIGTSAFWGPDYTDANDGVVEAFLGLTLYFGGNKDRDNDGILNEMDACPEVAEDMDGFQDADGCPDPDNDGDGVLDAMDQCPDTPVGIEVDENGCPVVQVLKTNLVLEGVNFASGKAELRPESFSVLDKVAESLLAWPDVTIEIQGHTDSTGGAELNRKLSGERAESVKAYLVLVGVAADRMTAVGYGEDNPVADNNTREGRAQNRRVELVRTDKP